MVISLERDADLLKAQLMPLPLTVSCFSESRLILPFWFRPTLVVLEKGPFNVCVCVCVCLSVWSEVQTCVWPSGFHCHSLSIASVKSRLVLPFWYWLIRVVLDRGPLNGCVCVVENCRPTDCMPLVHGLCAC